MCSKVSNWGNVLPQLITVLQDLWGHLTWAKDTGKDWPDRVVQRVRLKNPVPTNLLPTKKETGGEKIDHDPALCVLLSISISSFPKIQLFSNKAAGPQGGIRVQMGNPRNHINEASHSTQSRGWFILFTQGQTKASSRPFSPCYIDFCILLHLRKHGHSIKHWLAQK